jgi:hypothetical protein
VPTPQHHLQNVLDHVPTTVAMVTAGSASSAAILIGNLDVAAKVVALVVGLMNVIWIGINITGAVRKWKRGESHTK